MTAKVVAIIKWLKEHGLGVNDFAIDWRNIPRQETYVQKVPSLCQTQTVSLWGLGGTVIQLVGGVDLTPYLIEVPSTIVAETIHNHVGQALQTSSGTSVGELRTKDQTLRFSILPLTGGSQRILGTRPIAVHEGVTYAADERHRVCQAFNAYGNSAIFEYNDRDELVSTRLHTGEDWELQARVVDSDRRDFAVRTARR